MIKPCLCGCGTKVKRSFKWALLSKTKKSNNNPPGVKMPYIKGGVS